MGIETIVSSTGARRTLRRLELEAYASVVSAFRAQGPLSGEKKTALELLCKQLGISGERHRAEVRRAVNDELLSTVAVCISSTDTDLSWRKEGHKLASTNPRFVSRQVTHLPQALTSVLAGTTIGPLVERKGEESTKTTSVQLQNALKFIISQKPLHLTKPLGRVKVQPVAAKAATQESSPMENQSPIKNPTVALSDSTSADDVMAEDLTKAAAEPHPKVNPIGDQQGDSVPPVGPPPSQGEAKPTSPASKPDYQAPKPELHDHKSVQEQKSDPHNPEQEQAAPGEEHTSLDRDDKASQATGQDTPKAVQVEGTKPKESSCAEADKPSPQPAATPEGQLHVSPSVDGKGPGGSASKAVGLSEETSSFESVPLSPKQPSTLPPTPRQPTTLPPAPRQPSTLPPAPRQPSTLSSLPTSLPSVTMQATPTSLPPATTQSTPTSAAMQTTPTSLPLATVQATPTSLPPATTQSTPTSAAMQATPTSLPLATVQATPTSLPPVTTQTPPTSLPPRPVTPQVPPPESRKRPASPHSLPLPPTKRPAPPLLPTPTHLQTRTPSHTHTPLHTPTPTPGTPSIPIPALTPISTYPQPRDGSGTPTVEAAPKIRSPPPLLSMGSIPSSPGTPLSSETDSPREKRGLLQGLLMSMPQLEPTSLTTASQLEPTSLNIMTSVSQIQPAPLNQTVSASQTEPTALKLTSISSMAPPSLTLDSPVVYTMAPSLEVTTPATPIQELATPSGFVPTTSEDESGFIPQAVAMPTSEPSMLVAPPSSPPPSFTSTLAPPTSTTPNRSRSPTPTTEALIQAVCSDPSALEDPASLASQLGLDFLDPTLLNISDLMQLIQPGLMAAEPAEQVRPPSPLGMLMESEPVEQVASVESQLQAGMTESSTPHPHVEPLGSSCLEPSPVMEPSTPVDLLLQSPMSQTGTGMESNLSTPYRVEDSSMDTALLPDLTSLAAAADESELLEGISPELAATIQALARLDEQSSMGMSSTYPMQ